MFDLSLHLLDIIENSISAKATLVKVYIYAEILRNKLIIRIEDNGKGMDEETLKEAQNPFYTSKKERKKKVGLGIPLFRQNAESSNGKFTIKSEMGTGTVIFAEFQYDYIDRLPFGKLEDTIISSVIGHPEVDFIFTFKRKKMTQTSFFELNTIEIKEALEGIPLNYPDVANFIKETVQNGLTETEFNRFY